MALEDVVQGVQVAVKTDGVDEAKSKIGELDRAIGDLAKTAESASGANGNSAAGRVGIGGLTKAFSDLSTVGAEAFSNIARSAASGDITGLAALIGGPIAGSFVQTAKAISQFIDMQDAAILKNASLARELGTTPNVVQGVREGFESAGISAGGFERLVNRMSRQVTNDYAGMMASLRTDTDTQEKAALRLEEAQEKLAISLGAPKETYAGQDQLREQQQARIAVEDALEAKRQTALRSIPNVTEKLKESAAAHKQDTDLMEVSMTTLRKSIEYMAGSAPGHIASGIDVLKTEFDLIQSGAIDSNKALELLMSQMGSMRAAGLGGMDAQHAVEYAQKYGAGGITAAQSGQTAIQQLGLGQGAGDANKATETIAAWSKVTGLMNGIMAKIGGAAGAHIATPMLDQFAEFLEKAVGIFTGQTGLKSTTGLKNDISTGSFWGGQLTRDMLGATRTPIGLPPELANAGTSPETENALNAPSGKDHVIWSVLDKDSAPWRRYAGTNPEGTAHQEPIQNALEPTRILERLFGGPLLPSSSDTAGKITEGGNSVADALNTVAQVISTAASGIINNEGAPARRTTGQWQGGPIRFAGGGRVRVTGGGPTIPGFAEGGMAGPMAGLLQAGIKVGSGIWNRVKAMAPNSPEEAREMVSDLLRGHVTGAWMEEGVVSGLEVAGIEASRAAIGTSLGVMSNPFGTGILDASLTAAGDYKAGANEEEAAGRALGAHNLREAAQIRSLLVDKDIPGFATGSIRGPGNGTSDSILARVSNGEFIMKDAAVRTYGEGFMHAINNMQIPPPKYTSGGMVPVSSIPRFSEGGSMERAGSILNLHVGSEVFRGLSAPAAVSDQLRKFAISQQTSQTGKQPSWVGG